jgi:hypothetical protein
MDMMKRFGIGLGALALGSVLAAAAHAQGAGQSELRLIPETRVEKLAGVWVDGQYVGYVDQFKGHDTLTLAPGKHSLVVRESGMEGMTRELNLAPGGALDLVVKLMEPDPSTVIPEGPGELKVMVAPESAAVFVDGKFAGPAVQFGSVGRVLRLPEGKHEVRISQTGYKDYVTSVDISASERQTIEWRLDSTGGAKD